MPGTPGIILSVERGGRRLTGTVSCLVFKEELQERHVRVRCVQANREEETIPWFQCSVRKQKRNTQILYISAFLRPWHQTESLSLEAPQEHFPID